MVRAVPLPKPRSGHDHDSGVLEQRQRVEGVGGLAGVAGGGHRFGGQGELREDVHGALGVVAVHAL
eukprot:scaffold4848_cov99-Isochrysis_galbana.AAC.2